MFTPRERTLLYSLDRRLGGPQNRSGRCGEDKIFYPCRESNPNCPARCPSRRHGHRTDKNGVYSTFIFHLILVFNSFNYACLLLPTSPFCNSGCTKRTIYPRKRVLRTDPKENTSRFLLTGRCLATDPRKERITPFLGCCHSNVPKKNRPQRKPPLPSNR
jgi:hypothetical protein